MKKLILIAGAALCCVALILVSVGVTIAWFTDAKETTNVFTAGDVTIRLTELNPENDVIDVTDHGTQMDYGHVYPGRVITKNTTVTNIGSEDAYVAAEIVILDGDHDINSALKIPGLSGTQTPIDQFFFGGAWGEEFRAVESEKAYLVVYESENYIIQYDSRMTDGFWINIFRKDILKSGEELDLMGGFTFPVTWKNEEMLECTDLRISMKVFAAQGAGFTSCTEAIKTAFGTEFGIPDDIE